MTATYAGNSDSISRARVGAVLAIALYFVGYVIFDGYFHTFDSLMTIRIENFGHFGLLPLGLLLAQGHIGFITKKPEVVLLVLVMFGPFFAPPMVWDGPPDEGRIAQMLFGFKGSILIVMVAANAILCRLILIHMKKVSVLTHEQNA